VKQFEVWLRSVPGFYTQYDGKVEVCADNEDEAVERAFDKLRRTSFPDRSRSMWRIEKVERVWGEK
jgi:acylphosphatase